MTVTVNRKDTKDSDSKKLFNHIMKSVVAREYRSRIKSIEINFIEKEIAAD